MENDNNKPNNFIIEIIKRGKIFKEIEISIKSILKASKIVKYYYKSLPKQDNVPPTIVTKADIESEKIIIEEIKKEFLNDGICSEETNKKWDSNKKRIWIIDPIDGTKGFCKKTNEFCIQLCLYDNINKNIIFSLIYQPLTNLLYSAFYKKGAYICNLNEEFIEYFDKLEDITKLNFSKLKIKENSSLKILLSKNLPKKYIEKIQKVLKIDKIYKGYSMGLKMCWIAQGLYDIYIAPKNIEYHTWDVSPGKLIIEEAEGIVKDWDGNNINIENVTIKKGIIVSSKNNFSKILNLIKLIYN